MIPHHLNLCRPQPSMSYKKDSQGTQWSVFVEQQVCVIHLKPHNYSKIITKIIIKKIFSDLYMYTSMLVTHL